MKDFRRLLMKDELKFYQQSVHRNEPRTPGLEARTLPLCYATPWSRKFNCEVLGLASPSTFFCSTSFCHKLVLDGFDQHFQATVHCSKQRRRLTSATSKISEKTLGTLGIEPGLAG